MAEASSVFDDLDFETANLILKLQLEDVQELRSRSKGKNREDQVDNAQVALDLQEQNLECLRSLISDRHMTQSITNAIETDGRTISEAVRATQSGNPQNCVLDDKVLSKLAGQYMSENIAQQLYNNIAGKKDGSTQMTSETETRIDGAVTGPGSGRYRCVICLEVKKFFEVMEAPCGHPYCKPCLRELFVAATKDEQMYPPRCCKRPLDIKEVEIFLTKEIKDNFARSAIEFTTSDRTYCSSRSCLAFIAPNKTKGDTAVCLDCGTKTCITCKSRAHSGDCPEDTPLQEVLALAKKNGWKRCYSCRRLVELNYGCYHMT